MIQALAIVASWIALCAAAYLLILLLEFIV